MEVAMRMMSQMNVGMSGVVGFRFEALPVVFQALGVTDELDVLDGVRVIEAEIVRLLSGGR